MSELGGREHEIPTTVSELIILNPRSEVSRLHNKLFSSEPAGDFNMYSTTQTFEQRATSKNEENEFSLQISPDSVMPRFVPPQRAKSAVSRFLPITSRAQSLATPPPLHIPSFVSGSLIPTIIAHQNLFDSKKSIGWQHTVFFNIQARCSTDDGLGLSLNALGGDVPRKTKGAWAVVGGGVVGWYERFVIV